MIKTPASAVPVVPSVPIIAPVIPDKNPELLLGLSSPSIPCNVSLLLFPPVWFS